MKARKMKKYKKKKGVVIKLTLNKITHPRFT